MTPDDVREVGQNNSTLLVNTSAIFILVKIRIYVSL